jgi:hypothetical protein
LKIDIELLCTHINSGFGAVFSVKLQLDPNDKKKERVAIKKLPHKVLLFIEVTFH